MSNLFCVGSEVILKKNRITAVIIYKYNNNRFKIRDQDNFEYNVSLSEIIYNDPLTNFDSAYGFKFDVKNVDLHKINHPLTLNKSNSKKNKIDLHIENILDNFNNLKSEDIIYIQMNFCKKKLDLSISSKEEKIEIIHGIGQGFLKSKVHELLKNYNLNYYESIDGGSTIVML
tara:strand:- start:23249 stop:23767 length:519 start_codon:yes stop_codon:yes gene_type:complete